MAREYIRNPETNRLVDAHGRLGQRIIRKLQREGKPIIFQEGGKKKKEKQILKEQNENFKELETVKAVDLELLPEEQVFLGGLLEDFSGDY